MYLKIPTLKVPLFFFPFDLLTWARKAIIEIFVSYRMTNPTDLPGTEWVPGILEFHF